MNLDVKYDCSNDEYYTKVRHNNQDHYLAFQLFDSDDYTTLYSNVVANVWTKRKHADANMNNAKITGKDPFFSYSYFKSAFLAIENEIIEHEFKPKSYSKLIISCGWTSAKRRDAYYKILKNYGYKFGIIDNEKVLLKIIKREEI